MVYDQWPISEQVPPDAETNGQTVFTPPEGASPGIVVSNVSYPDASNPSRLILDGCIKTSSSAASDDVFQSGKRAKQQMTNTAPVELVFNLAP